jgi:hypothetical protein
MPIYGGGGGSSGGGGSGGGGFSTGTGAPSGGSDGQAYIDTSSRTVYVHTGGSWVAYGVLMTAGTFVSLVQAQSNSLPGSSGQLWNNSGVPSIS